MFIEVPYFLENPPPLKNSWLRACFVNSIFAEGFCSENPEKEVDLNGGTKTNYKAYTMIEEGGSFC